MIAKVLVVAAVMAVGVVVVLTMDELGHRNGRTITRSGGNTHMHCQGLLLKELGEEGSQCTSPQTSYGHLDGVVVLMLTSLGAAKHSQQKREARQRMVAVAAK